MKFEPKSPTLVCLSKVKNTIPQVQAGLEQQDKLLDFAWFSGLLAPFMLVDVAHKKKCCWRSCFRQIWRKIETGRSTFFTLQFYCNWETISSQCSTWGLPSAPFSPDFDSEAAPRPWVLVMHISRAAEGQLHVEHKHAPRSLLDGHKGRCKASLWIKESLCVSENVRIPCVESGVVEPLVRLMASNQLPVITQSCRALGNICFDNGKFSLYQCNACQCQRVRTSP